MGTKSHVSFNQLRSRTNRLLIVAGSHLRVVSEQDESLHHVYGVSRHREHLGHQVAVALEKGHGPELNVHEQRRHSSKRLQVLLTFISCRRYQRLQTLSLDGHLDGRCSQ